MKNGILVVSFGSSIDGANKNTISPLLEELNRRYGKDYHISEGFTSKRVLGKLNLEKNKYLYFEDALINILKKDIDKLYILPYMILKAGEYEKVVEVIEVYRKKTNVDIYISSPLLEEGDDYWELVEALEIDGLDLNEGLIFMGHGSNRPVDNEYLKIENLLKEKHGNIYMATLKDLNSIGETVERVRSKGLSKVTLRPFMLFSGFHVERDMKSKDQNSWKNLLLSEGIDTEASSKALGELKGIREIFIKKLSKTIDNAS